MPRLIDADALRIENVDLEHGCTVVDYALAVIKSVRDALTIEAEPVVRCRDCEFYENKEYYYTMKACKHYAGLREPYPNDYCSRGKRKNDNT